MLHPSLVPLLSLPICFIKKSAQEGKLEKEFVATIGTMGRKSLPKGVHSSLSSSLGSYFKMRELCATFRL